MCWGNAMKAERMCEIRVIAVPRDVGMATSHLEGHAEDNIFSIARDLRYILQKYAEPEKEFTSIQFTIL